MRLYLAPFARPFLEDGNARRLAVLDLDDDEVETHARMAALHARLGNRRAADLEASDSVRYARFEREWLPRFDRLIVCAGRDRDALVRRRGSLPIEIAPNAVKPLALPAAPARETGRARVLFVGTLNYFPNEDAVIWLADDILPRIRALTGRLVELDVVGRGPSEALRRLGDRELVRVHADVADVAPFYAAADVVVAPVRAGGGTRIKLLEAFAAGVPVVATAIGAEGLDVEPGRELLVADNPWTMAEACSRILSDPQLARGLADRAAQFVAAWHDWRRVSADISGLFDRLSRRSGPGRVVGAAG
jgi:glycosyltransferase involved in cell wall biosynthesis